jgi:uncharacterized membrane protein YuzA (DUF378 family)
MNTLGVLLAIFLAKLFDPVAAIVGLSLGFSRARWWQVGLAAVAVAVFAEFMLRLGNESYRFNPLFFGFGVMAT